MFEALNKFKNSHKGNVAVGFAVSLPVVMVAMGSAIDFSMGVQGKFDLQQAVDSATLTAARLDRISPDGRRKHFRNEVRAMLADRDNLTITNFEFDVFKTRHAVEFKSTVTAVVDTHVMGVAGKDTIAIEASAKAVEEIKPVEVSLVLDVSSSMASMERIDKLKAATNDFIDEVMYRDGMKDRLVTVSIVPYGGTVKLPDELEDIVQIEGNSEHWEGGTWNGCLQYSEDDFNDSHIEDESFEYIPHFWRWNNGNWWCPETELVPPTNNVNALRQSVENFKLSDGTGTDHGILWGFKMLSPEWEGKLDDAERNIPAPYDSEALKIMVVMTDGGITSQLTPSDEEISEGEPAFQTTGSTQKVIYNRDQAQRNFISVCDQAKSNGIRIYTVGVELNQEWALEDLKKCATSANSHYFDVESEGLRETFRNIASAIHTPRLVE